MTDTEDPNDPNYRLLRATHLMALPKELFYTTDRAQQTRQVTWLVEQGQASRGWSVAEFYWGDIPLADFMNWARNHELRTQMINDGDVSALAAWDRQQRFPINPPPWR